MSQRCARRRCDASPDPPAALSKLSPDNLRSFRLHHLHDPAHAVADHIAVLIGEHVSDDIAIVSGHGESLPFGGTPKRRMSGRGRGLARPAAEALMKRDTCDHLPHNHIGDGSVARAPAVSGGTE